MHTRRKGKSASKKPIREEPLAWSNTNKEEIENTIVQLAGQGKSSSQIGMILRDSHGVPDVKLVIGKKLTAVMKEKKVGPKIPEDIRNLMVKLIDLKKHLDKNHNDVHNKRAYNNMESKIRRLEKYYHNEGILPKTWKYSSKKVDMLISR